MDKKNYSNTLSELLELSGIKIEEEIEEELSHIDEAAPEEPEGMEEPEEDDEKSATHHKRSGAKEIEPSPEEEAGEEEEEEEEELADTWEIQIKTGSKLKFEMFENYLYIWYRNRKSPRIDISSKIRPQRKIVAALFNKILTYVEKVS